MEAHPQSDPTIMAIIIRPVERDPPEGWLDVADALDDRGLFHKETTMDALMISILGGLARTAIAVGAGYLAKKGVDLGSIPTDLTSVALGGIAAGWSWLNKVAFHRDIQTAAVTGTVKK